MAGMIDKGKQAGSTEKPTDPILRQVVQRVEATLKPEVQQNYQAVVLSGMRLMWGDQFEEERQHVLSLINGPQDIPKVIAHVVAKVVSIVQNESKKTEPFPAAVPAGITLMCHALEFVEAAKKINIDKSIIDQTTMMVKDGIFGIYKITPQMLEHLARQQGQGTNVPPNLRVIPGGKAEQPAAPPAAQPGEAA
jgi:hypothetical protein